MRLVVLRYPFNGQRRAVHVCTSHPCLHGQLWPSDPQGDVVVRHSRVAAYFACAREQPTEPLEASSPGAPAAAQRSRGIFGRAEASTSPSPSPGTVGHPWRGQAWACDLHRRPTCLEAVPGVSGQVRVGRCAVALSGPLLQRGRPRTGCAKKTQQNTTEHTTKHTV